MINRFAIEERVREWHLCEDVIEKDYALGWVLWGIGAHPRLSKYWAFKGGTCLKKCYLETYRFSEDLDFTVLPDGPVRQADLEPIFRELLQNIADQSGINFNGRAPQFKTHSSGMYTERRIYYQGPRNTPEVASIRLDLSASEKAVRLTVLRTIAHAFPDKLPDPNHVRCYSFEEVFAEKLRAMGERARSRDLYDIVNLYWRADLQAHPQLIRKVLEEKCRSKSVPMPTAESFESSERRGEIEAEWSNMLSHQLQELPPFEHFWNELPKVFSWLDGTTIPPKRHAIAVAENEESPDQWSPPPTIWTWHSGVPLETIRFAAANHLCVTLGYGGSKRLIEPYSLRRTLDGNLILYAVKTDGGEVRSYRVDRMQSLQVSQHPFTPRHNIELSATGPIIAPPTVRNANHGIDRTTYVIGCPFCGKRFYRHKYNARLGTHKDQNGYNCVGRHGDIVDTRYS